MSDDEVPLRGGRLNPVVRVGDTVRRPAGPNMEIVHALLGHLAGAGFDLAPRPLGVDEQGREVLSYLPGETVGDAMPWPAWVWDEDLLVDVGRAVRWYHEAVADFRPAGVRPWHWAESALGEDQIICHHDLAPYNVVVRDGRLQGIIDWDLIGPGTPRAELAFVAWQWVPLHDPLVTSFFWADGSPDRAHRLKILLDAYGLTDQRRFSADVVARIVMNRDTIIRRAGAGEPAFIALRDEGHVLAMDRAIDYLTRHPDL